MPSQETAFTVGKRIGGRMHFPKVRISPYMKLAYQVQVIIQHFIKVPALLPGFGKDHRQVQRYCAYIKTPHKHRGILIVCRMHPPAFIPGRKKSAAAHRGDHLAILLVHAGNIPFAGKGKPVRIHGLGRAFHPCFKHLLQFFPGAM